MNRVYAALLALTLMFTPALADTSPENPTTATNCLMVAAYKLAKMGKGLTIQIEVHYEGRVPEHTDISPKLVDQIEENSGLDVAYYSGAVITDYTAETKEEFLTDAYKNRTNEYYRFTCATANDIPVVPFFEIWPISAEGE